MAVSVIVQSHLQVIPSPYVKQSLNQVSVVEKVKADHCKAEYVAFIV